MTEKEERAIARLRESKIKTTNELFTAGEVAGSEYVLLHADFRELERLERWDASLGMNRSSVMNGITFRKVAEQMNEDAGDAIEDRARDANGDDIDSPIWIMGFISGARYQYAVLKPHLN